MDVFFDYLLMILLIWIIIFIILEFYIIFRLKMKVKTSYELMEEVYLDYLNNIQVGIDKIKEYSSLDAKSLEKDLGYLWNEENFEITEECLNKMRIVIKKIELFDEAFEELKSDSKYIEIKENLKSFDDGIKKCLDEYNLNIRVYDNKIKSFPTFLISVFLSKEDFDVIDLNNN